MSSLRTSCDSTCGRYFAHESRCEQTLLDIQRDGKSGSSSDKECEKVGGFHDFPIVQVHESPTCSISRVAVARYHATACASESLLTSAEILIVSRI